MAYDLDTVTISDILADDVIDLRDITDLYEELREIRQAVTDWNAEDPASRDEDCPEDLDEDQAAVYKALTTLLDDLRNDGGDHYWEGDWYPISLISDDYFEEYAQELCEDIGVVPKDLPSWVAIDWEKTAQAVQQDYSSVEIDGNTFWYH